MPVVDKDSLLSQYDANGTSLASKSVPPHGNHGENTESKEPKVTPPPIERSRLSVDLSPVVLSHLDHISEVTGVSKAGIISSALLESLPALLARADGLKKRHQELNQVKKK